MFRQGRQLDWSISPLDAVDRWPTDERLVMLHSGRPHPKWSRYTFLARPEGTYRLVTDRAGGWHARWRGPDRVLPVEPSGRPFTDLRMLQQSTGEDALWAGYLSYDLGRWPERMRPHRCVDRQFPIMEWAWCPGFLLHDAIAGTWHACGTWRAGGFPDLPREQGSAQPTRDKQPAYSIDQPPRPDQSPDAYEAAVAQALEHIAAGDIFQVNLSQRFTATYTGQYPAAHRAIYRRLAQQSPAWYGAYLELDSTDAPARSLASISPELFVEMDARGKVVTRPIKGTRPADVDAEELRRSEKDAAELHMIVDLLRNDLGRVCDYGSVRVLEPRTIESHPTVHHGVATIAGQLHASKDMADLLRAMMPGGSITGAPKIRAMQIIDALEPTARGPYCGSIGYFTRDRACFNIAIRTMLLEQLAETSGCADYCVGGGIVADSTPRGEYDETITKAAAMRAVLCNPSPRADTESARTSDEAVHPSKLCR